MIQKLLLAKGYGILFVIFLLLLLPKVALWYQAEAMLKKFDIILDGEIARDHWTHLELTQGTLMIQGLEMAKISKASLNLWLLANGMRIENLFSGKNAQMLQGLSIEQASITHHIFAPLTLFVQAHGSFGTLEGEISLRLRNIELHITPTAALRRNTLIMQQLKATKEGYTYVKSF